MDIMLPPDDAGKYLTSCGMEQCQMREYVAPQLVAEGIYVQEVCCGQRRTTAHPRAACCCHGQRK